MARETLVVEANCSEPVGSDKEGSEKIKNYLKAQAEILNCKTVVDPETHLSPRYGFSGWVPLENGDEHGAIHLYAWDHENEPHPPFVSVDFAMNQPIDPETKEKILKSTAEHFMGLEGQVVFKTTYDDDSSEWRDLAPHITRQRLSIFGELANDGPIDEGVDAYLKELSEKLNMAKLSEPIIHTNENRGTAWMHWETSGTIATWNNDTREADVDIYTCKAFSPEDAIDFTREKLGLTIHSTKEY